MLVCVQDSTILLLANEFFFWMCHLFVANDILKQALTPGLRGIPFGLAENAVAVVIITVAQAGLVFSGSLGTGILMRKKKDGLTWSKPSACGLTGFGWGPQAGVSVKDLIVFINHEAGVEALLSETGLEVGGRAEVTLGPFGRAAGLDMNMSPDGHGMTYAIAFSKGAFLGVSMQGAVIGARQAINMYFYGKEVTTREILMDEDALDFPSKWASLMDEVYAKLIYLTTAE